MKKLTIALLGALFCLMASAQEFKHPLDELETVYNDENVTFRKMDDHTWVGSGNVMSSETMAIELLDGKANGTNEGVHGTGMDRVLVRDGFRLNYNTARLEAERGQ